MPTASKRILIAYADRGRVFDLGQKCRDLGLEVVGVHDADTALWFLKNERPSLVCMDAELETADGISLGEKIAADEDLVFVPVIVMQNGTARQAMRYPSLCTHFVDRSEDLWAQLQPLLVELLELDPPEKSPAMPAAAPAALIEPETLSTLSQSLRRLDSALASLEQSVGQASADPVRPNADRVDAVFEQLAQLDEPAEAATAKAGNRKNITRRDEATSRAVTFPLADTAPRVFAPPAK